MVGDVDLVLRGGNGARIDREPRPVDEGRVECGEVIDRPVGPAIVAVGQPRLEEERRTLNRRNVDAMGSGEAARRRCCARRRTADGDVDVADVIAEYVDDRRLYEAAATVIRARDVRTTRLPGDVDRPVGVIHGDVRLGRVRFGFRGDHLSEAEDVPCARRHGQHERCGENSEGDCFHNASL